MKKLLLLLSLCAFNGIYAQDVLFSEDCTALTVGNIGTDLTGATPGQHNWFTYVGLSGANSDFQIANVSGTNGNVIKITGANTNASTTAPTNTKYLSQDLSAAWTNRTSGNDIAQVAFDFYTGPATTSANTMRVILYDSTGGEMLAGIKIAMNTLIISGLAYYDNTANTGGVVGNYGFGLSTTAGSNITLTPNTWYRFGFSYDYNTGDVTWREVNNGLFNGYVTGAAAGTDVSELDLVAAAGTTNAASATGTFDNIFVNADATDSLLSTKSNALVANNISVYPNPSRDLVNISNDDSSIKTIEMTDLNGRVVKTVNVADSSNVQVNISDLSVGVYMMKIVSDKGTTTKKVIKE